MRSWALMNMMGKCARSLISKAPSLRKSFHLPPCGLRFSSPLLFPLPSLSMPYSATGLPSQSRCAPPSLSISYISPSPSMSFSLLLAFSMHWPSPSSCTERTKWYLLVLFILLVFVAFIYYYFIILFILTLM